MKRPQLVLALYAINPVAIRVGDSLRPYGLGIALILLTLALMWDFVKTPGPKAFCWAALAAILSVQCLYQNAFFVLAYCCGAWVVTLGRRDWKTAIQTGMIGLLAALSLLPYCVILKECREWVIPYKDVSFDSIGQSLFGALGAPGAWMVPVWLVLLVTVLAVVFVCGRSERGGPMVYGGAVLVVSAVLTWAFCGGRNAAALVVFPHLDGASGFGGRLVSARNSWERVQIGRCLFKHRAGCGLRFGLLQERPFPTVKH